MAQVITRCRLTGHYMFMGMEADPKEFTRSPGPFARKFCPFCACDHLWHKEDLKFLAPKDGAAPAHPASELIGWSGIKAVPIRMTECLPISGVTRGLDPRVHLLRKKMDCRVKAGNDGGEAVAGILRPFEREPLWSPAGRHRPVGEP